MQQAEILSNHSEGLSVASVRKRKWTKCGVEREAWVVDYHDRDGKRHLKTFERKKDADTWRTTALHEIGAGTHTPASKSVTIATAAKLWLVHCKAEGLEHSTVLQRDQHIRLHINPLVGKVKLADLTAPRVHAFLGEMRDGGRSLAMRRKVLTNLKTLLTFAQARGLVAQNVARAVSAPSDRRKEAPDLRPGVEMPTKAELRDMLDAAPAPRWRAFMAVAIFTGMRASELRGPRWVDVDLDEGVVHIRQRASLWGTMGPPKSKAGIRDIPLTPMAVNALKKWSLACPNGEAGLVFPNGKGKVENHANIVNRFFQPLQESLFIVAPTGGTDDDSEPVMRAKYSLHALRHAAASLFIEQGWNVKKVQTVLGHGSAAMTLDRYGKLFKDSESDREAMKRVEAALVVNA